MLRITDENLRFYLRNIRVTQTVNTIFQYYEDAPSDTLIFLEMRADSKVTIL